MLSELEHLYLPIYKLGGQSYDYAANMSCQYNGVKTIIMNRHPLTLYTMWSSSHKLNSIIIR